MAVRGTRGVPISTTGIMQVAYSATGAVRTSHGWALLTAGTVALSTTKAAGAFFNPTLGAWQNTDGTMYVGTSTTGAFKTCRGLMMNSAGAIVKATSKAAGARRNRQGFMVNPDGKLVTSS